MVLLRTLINRLLHEEGAQGASEYVLALCLVALGFWVARKNINMRPILSNVVRSVRATLADCAKGLRPR